MRIKPFGLLLCSVVYMLCASVHAVDIGMVFKGTLVKPPPCVVNSGQDISVPFGKIGINKINGENYRKGVEVNLDCNAPPPWVLVMTLTTQSEASFSEATIQSNVPGLGIKVYIDGEPMRFSEPVIINPGKLPKLEVIPVNEPGVTLKEGEFTASATLSVEYQ